MTRILCGVDVAGRHLDARLRPETAAGRRFANTAEGVAELAAFCREHGVTLVVMEATGGYEKLAFGLLWAAGVPAALTNPRQVRREACPPAGKPDRGAEAMGLLEKTDRLRACPPARERDRGAGVIAWYAEARRLTAQPPAGETQDRLAALVTRLRQLTELQVAQRHQRRLVTEARPALRPAQRDRGVLASVDEVLALLARQVRGFEAKIAALIGKDPAWQALDAAFRSIKGVAGRTVARLLAELPEIGTLSNKAAAKLAGLAPLAQDSGQRNGRRPIRGGRTGVRSILVVVAGVVCRHDPDFKACHARLTTAGKPKMVLRVALARKLLVRLNAKARDARRAMAAVAA